MPVVTHNFLWDLLSETLFTVKDKEDNASEAHFPAPDVLGLHNQHLRLLVSYTQCR